MHLRKMRHWTLTLISAISVILIGKVSASSLPASMGIHDSVWQLIGPTGGEMVLDIDVDLQRPVRLYTTTTDGIYRSTDGGSTWNLILDGFFRDLVIDPQNSDIIYTGPGIYKSTDGGDTWTRYNEGMTCSNLATLAIAATNPSILFTGSF